MIEVQTLNSGGTLVTIRGEIPAAALQDSVASIGSAKERAAVEHQIERHQARVLTASAPSQRGAFFVGIPQLCAEMQGNTPLILVDGDLLAAGLSRLLVLRPAKGGAGCPNFTASGRQERAYLIDIERGKLRIEQERQDYP
ncbi:MAG: hypothetical protein IPL06_03430 [Betaproteobacteria bacterium]|nr:hypothetical protein [Betaproteobacteria bacterium]